MTLMEEGDRHGWAAGFAAQFCRKGETMRKRAAVAMSGGVDSSAAAVLLLEAGYEVYGITLRLRPEPTGSAGDDIATARAVADKLGIRHEVLDLRSRFSEAVMDRFVAEYVKGRTPNPCVDCNRTIKFGALLDYVLENGADFLATGHYARIDREEPSGRLLLLRGRDRRKDQSYFLYQLSQRQLSHLLFPVGDFEKQEIRAVAMAHGLKSADRPESQDICFVPGGDYVAFLREYGGIDPAPGDFVDETGRVLGRHRGLVCYTAGQRKGLGVSAEEPLYVVSKDLTAGTIRLGPNSALYSGELTAGALNWISVSELKGPLPVTAKTRYSQQEAAATVEPLENNLVHVLFDEPQRAVTPGQAVVFYDGERVVGGGTIC